MAKSSLTVMLLAALMALTCGCGYHTLGASAHLPSEARTLAIPVFATRTNAYHTEVVMTRAVVREMALRTRLRVVPEQDAAADLVLEGTIISQTATPLTYNSLTQQSSSFLVTMVIQVVLKTRDGKVLYQNPNYVFRQQYQATTDLPTFLDESPAAVQRLSRDFARQLTADVLEGL